MIVAMLENHERYGVEGFVVTSRHVYQLVKLFPRKIEQCLLGYYKIDLFNVEL